MKYYLILSCILLTSCFCRKVSHTLQGEYELNTQDTLAFGYTKDQIIPLKHSNGYEFNLKVTEKKLMENTIDERCIECCEQSYIILHEQEIILKANYPNLDIHIQSSSSLYTDYYSFSNTPHAISINNRYSGYFETDSLGQVITDQFTSAIDTLVLFDKYYTSVYKIELSPSYGRNDQNLIAYPAALYYAEKRIIKIEFDNGEFYGVL